MKFEPRPYQKLCYNDALQFLRNAEPGQRRFYVSPTGTGKSVIELMLHEELHDSWIVTPTVEIIDGMRDKLGREPRAMTPIKLRNRLLSGEIDPPRYLIFDEGHHSEADTWQSIMLLCGMAPAVGFSATGFRGTPKSTKQFLDFWGEPIHVMTYKQAIDRNYIKFPSISFLPLVDDDSIDIVNGEFEVTRLEEETRGRLEDLAVHAKQWFDGHSWDRPTVFSLPTRQTCREFVRICAKYDLPMFTIDANTSREDRLLMFHGCVERVLAFVHVNVVSEGVDLPLRRYVDAHPVVSPVQFLQRFGRITRPTDEFTEYVCTNRNLCRHAHLLEGCIPVSKYLEGEKAFPAPSRRSGTRVVGMENLGRFKPIEVKLRSGITLTCYMLSCIRENKVVQYAALIHPLLGDPIWAERQHRIREDRTRDYGRWVACAAPDGLSGFNSIGQGAVTEKMMNWWKRAAGRHGLDPDIDVNRKSFNILPIAADLDLRF